MIEFGSPSFSFSLIFETWCNECEVCSQVDGLGVVKLNFGKESSELSLDFFRHTEWAAKDEPLNEVESTLNWFIYLFIRYKALPEVK